MAWIYGLRQACIYMHASAAGAQRAWCMVVFIAIILHWHTETHQVASTGLEGTVGLVHLITKLDDN